LQQQSQPQQERQQQQIHCLQSSTGDIIGDGLGPLRPAPPAPPELMPPLLEHVLQETDELE
jgi:hypothetical protein